MTKTQKLVLKNFYYTLFISLYHHTGKVKFLVLVSLYLIQFDSAFCSGESSKDLQDLISHTDNLILDFS